jgi:hypothetical protein
MGTVWAWGRGTASAWGWGTVQEERGSAGVEAVGTVWASGGWVKGAMEMGAQSAFRRLAAGWMATGQR